MKTPTFLGILLLSAAITLSLNACSSEDDPVAEEYIEGKMPANILPGMVYAVSHDKKNDKCTFELYLGDYQPKDMGHVHVLILDRFRNALYNAIVLSKWNEESGRSELVSNTFTISSWNCEQATIFSMYLPGSFYEIYPSLEEARKLNSDIINVFVSKDFDGNVNNIQIEQLLKPAHHFFE
ncbi:MAG: hypothetical protein Q4D30_10240 [Bacteroidales bacterium]|nr:hypothetical protein [Bacteroidales bacterium]